MTAGVSRAAEIAAQLRKSEGWRLRSEALLTMGTAVLAAIPGMGPIGVLTDKIGSKLISGDVEQRLQELCDVVAVLEPSLDRLDDLEDRVATIGQLLAANQALADRVESVLRALFESTPEVRVTSSNKSSQAFTDVVMNNMRLIAEARSGSHNSFTRTHVIGDAHFTSDNGSHQDVQQSTFSAPRGGSVGLDGTRLRGGIQVKPGAPKDGKSLKYGDVIGSISFSGNPSDLKTGDVVGSIEFIGSSGRPIGAISVTTVGSNVPSPDRESGFWVDKLGKKAT